MSGSELPEKLRLFIFQYIDSVELIEVLMYLRINNQEWKTCEQVSRELRSNQSSVKSRLGILQSLGLIVEHQSLQGSFRFSPATEELNEVVELLTEAYKVKRHKVLELMFSSAKHAREFANAFVIGKDSKKKEDGRG